MTIRELTSTHTHTHAQIAARGGVTRQTISRILSGDRRPSLDLALALWRAFGVPVEVWER